MTLDDLERRVTERIAASPLLTLDDATLDATRIDALVADSPLADTGLRVVLAGPPARDGQALRCPGRASLLGLVEARAALELRVDADEPQVVLRVACPGAWTLATSFPELAGSPLAELTLREPAFVFVTEGEPEDPAGLRPGVNFTAGLTLDGPAAPAAELLGLDAGVPLLLRGQVTGSARAPRLDLVARVDAAPRLGPVALVEPHVGAFLVRGAAGVDADLYCGADVRLGERALRVTGRLQRDGDVLLEARAEDALLEPGDLGALLGDGDWAGLLPEELRALSDARLRAVVVSGTGRRPRDVRWIRVEADLPREWEALDGRFAVRGLRAAWTCHWPLRPRWRHHALSLAGEAHVGGHALEVEVQCGPGLAGHCRLKEPASFGLAELGQAFLEQALPVPAGLPPLAFEELRLTVERPARTVDLGASLHTEVDLLGLPPVVVKPLVVEATRGPAGLSARLTGFVDLGELMVSLTAELSPANARGRFEGQLFHAEPLSLGRVAARLLPPGLPVLDELLGLGLLDPKLGADLTDRSFWLEGRLDAARVPLGELGWLEASWLRCELGVVAPRAWSGAAPAAPPAPAAAPAAWWAGVEATGRLKLGGGVELPGRLRIDPGGLRFVPDPPATLRLPVLLGAVPGQPLPTVDLRLDGITLRRGLPPPHRRLPGEGWALLADGALSFANARLPRSLLELGLGARDLAGLLLVDAQGLRWKPDDGRFRLALPLPGAPALEGELGHVSLLEVAGPPRSWSFAARVTWTLGRAGLPGPLQRRLPDTLDVGLYVGQDAVRFAVDPLLPPFEVDLGQLPLAEGLPFPPGAVRVEVDNLQVAFADDLELTADVGLGLPAGLNGVFTGLVLGAFEPWRTYRPGDPSSLVRLALRAAGDGLRLQCLTSPFHGWELTRTRIAPSPFAAAPPELSQALHDLDLTWRTPAWDPSLRTDAFADLGDAGQLRFTSPVLHHDAPAGLWRALGSLSLLRLALPMGLVKRLLARGSLKALAEALPDALPLRDLALVDAGGRLDVTAFEAEVGALPRVLREALAAGGERLRRLPSRLVEYLRIAVPTELGYELSISPAGDVALGLSLALPPAQPVPPATAPRLQPPGPAPTSQVRRAPPTLPELASGKPVKLLWVSPAPVPELVGLSLSRVELGLVRGLVTLRFDADMDRYDAVTLGLALALPEQVQGPGRPLPSSKDLVLHAVGRDVFCVISSGLPIPLFWKELSLERLGVEGYALRSEFRNPMPSRSIFALAALVAKLVPFLRDPDARLDPAAAPRGLDPTFTVGPQWLRAPSYLGGQQLGSTGDVHGERGWPYAARGLNALKFQELWELLLLVPLDVRAGELDLALGPARARAGWLVSSARELPAVTAPPFGAQQALLADLLGAARAGATASVHGGEGGAGAAAEHDELAVVASGRWDLAGAGLDVLVGGSGSRRRGWGTGLRVAGAVGGGLVDLTLGGRFDLDPDRAAAPLSAKATLALAVQRRDVFEADAELGPERVAFAGALDLYPSGPLTVRGDVAGELTRSDFDLAGEVAAELAGMTLEGARVRISREAVEVRGRWLGQVVTLRAELRGGEVALVGAVTLSLDLSIELGTITKAAKVAECLAFSCDPRARLELVVVPSRGFEASLEASFSLNGRRIEVGPSTLTAAPASLEDLGGTLIEDIESRPVEMFDAIFPSAGQWLALTKGVFPPDTKVDIPWVRDAHLCWQNPLLDFPDLIVDGLKDGFGLARDAAARAMNQARLTAEEAIKGLESAFTGDPSALAGSARNAGYAAVGVARGLRDHVTTDPREVARALIDAGYQAAATATALRDALGQGAQAVADALGGLGVPGMDALGALIGAFPTVNLGTLELPFELPGLGGNMAAVAVPAVAPALPPLPLPAPPGLPGLAAPLGPSLPGPGPNGAARVTDLVLTNLPHCHAPIHPAETSTPLPHPAAPQPIVVGEVTVLIGGLPAARVGDLTGPCLLTPCMPGGPAMIASGSATVFIGGLPAARAMDRTLHPTCLGPIPSPTGMILPPGCPTVIIGD